MLIEELKRDVVGERDNLSEAGMAPSSHLAESIEVGLDSSYYELLSSSSATNLQAEPQLNFSSSGHRQRGILV